MALLPQGVAHGVFATQDEAAPKVSKAAGNGRPVGRRLAYPPAKQTLADRPRRASTRKAGGHGASPGTRKR